MSLAIRTRLVADVLVIAVFAAAVVMSGSFSHLARWFPYYVALFGCAVATIHAIRDFMLLRAGQDILGDGGIEAGLRQRADDEDAVIEQAMEYELDRDSWIGRRTPLFWWSYVFGYVALVAAFGMVAGSVVFIVLSLRLIAKTTLLTALITAILTVGLLQVLHDQLGVQLPRGEVIDLWERIVDLGLWH